MHVTIDTGDPDQVAALEMFYIFEDPLHGYFTGLAVNRPPSPEDKLTHWEHSGAGERFHRALRQKPFTWPAPA